ncbi:MAG: hypothetical protein A2157_07055 [Deltaproteobacteria bacterium RBG_16_47_11]|nr:MAG: hypothetical protein A2157_07055 [Deltaproteobacteria bacterium RBG_16_47_11]
MRNIREVVSSNRYRIFETKEYLDRLSRFSTSDQTFLNNKTRNYVYPQLQKEPHFGLNIKKLVNYDPETWRYRLGRFRLFYLIDESEKVVYLLTIDFRKDAYR